MTVFAKDTTYGLESIIKDCQTFLNTKLSSLWSGTIEVYGLLEKKLKNDIIVPEAWKGTAIGNKEYSEVFINDKVAATIGFVTTSRSLIPYKSATVDIIFTILLNKIYPNSTTRDKEKALLEAEKALEKFGGINEIIEVKEGVNDVFSGFDTDRIKYRDFHPWYVFSFSAELLYNDDSCR